MKNLAIFLTVTGGFLMGFGSRGILDSFIEQKVKLPEEYKSITKNDTLKGYFHNDVLYIEFNNAKNK